MATEVRRFHATIPAGTPIAVPVTVDIAFSPHVVHSVLWRMPPGAAGVVGWRLTMGGVQVVPNKSDLWVIDDAASEVFDLTDYPDSGAWQVTGYNTGAFPHTIYLGFHLYSVSRKPVLRPPLDPRSVMPVPDLSRAGAQVIRSR